MNTQKKPALELEVVSSPSFGSFGKKLAIVAAAVTLVAVAHATDVTVGDAQTALDAGNTSILTKGGIFAGLGVALFLLKINIKVIRKAFGLA